MINIFRLIRAKQWIKNLFIFFPAFFSGHIIDFEVTKLLFFGFLGFSLSASSIYIFNDLMDIERDKLHPQKKLRLLASGQVKKRDAIFISLSLLIASLIISYATNTHFLYLVILYVLINIFYSLGLKRLAIIDITIIAFGFLVRVYSGGVIADVYISKWLSLMTFLLAVFIALGKRHSELATYNRGKNIREVLSNYNVTFLEAAQVFIASITAVSYIMYSISDEVISRIGNDFVYVTSFFVVMGILRYLQLTIVFKKTGSPTDLVYKDAFLIIILILWVVTFYLLIYKI